MSVGSADLHKTIRNIWISSGLDSVFGSHYSVSDRQLFPTLHDGEATPKQPFPYCVYEVGAGFVESRMTGHHATEKHLIRDVPLVCYVHTKPSGAHSAKEFGAILAAEVMAKLGGHPAYRPVGIPYMDYGQVLQFQYQNDYGIRTGDEEYRWTIEYLIKLDVWERV